MSKISKDLVSIDEALGASRKQVKEWHQEYMNPHFDLLLELIGFDEVYDEAKGAEVFIKGESYIDCIGGYGVLSLGHNNREVIEAVEKVNSRPNMLQASSRPLAAALAKNLAEITPGNLQRTFFCNSGTEAVEGALKLARAATGKQKIAFAENCFHGKTMGALSANKKKYQTPFLPLVPGFEQVPFGDSAALRKKLREGGFAAFIVEPIQGEGGIIIPPKGYLKQVERICREYETLLIVDEVQTGLGRTGTMFACDHENVEPDILCLAKALGGGIAPIGAFVTTDEIWRKAYGGINRCLLHTSTYGGSDRVCAAAITTINILCRNNEAIIREAANNGAEFLRDLKQTLERYRMVGEVRGRGLLIGIEFKQPYVPFEGLSRFLKENFVALVAAGLKDEFHILTAYTFNNLNVLRLEPPLIVTERQLSYTLKSLEIICCGGFTRLLRVEGYKAVKRFVKRIF